MEEKQGAVFGLGDLQAWPCSKRHGNAMIGWMSLLLSGSPLCVGPWLTAGWGLAVRVSLVRQRLTRPRVHSHALVLGNLLPLSSSFVSHFQF